MGLNSSISRNFIIWNVVGLMVIIIGFFLDWFYLDVGPFSGLSAMTFIVIPIIAAITLVLFFIVPKISYYSALALSLLIIVEMVRVFLILFRIPTVIYGDMVASRLIPGPGFLLLIIGIVLISKIALQGLKGTYDSSIINKYRKWFFGIAGFLILIYVLAFSGLIGANHPEYGPIKTKFYHCVKPHITCDIDLGNRSDVAKKQQPIVKDLDPCDVCDIDVTYNIPNHDYPWLQVVAFFYSNPGGAKETYVETVKGDVRTISFGLDSNPLTPGKDYSVVIRTYYGFYKVFDDVDRYVVASDGSMNTNILINASFVKPDIDYLYSEKDVQEIKESMENDLATKLATAMTPEEQNYLQTNVMLEDFEHNAHSGEDAVFRRTLSGTIVNNGEKTINLAELIVTYNTGEERRYIIANNRETNKYAYQIFPAQVSTEFLYWDHDGTIDFRKVEYDDSEVQYEVNLEAVSARLEKIYFDW